MVQVPTCGSYLPQHGIVLIWSMPYSHGLNISASMALSSCGPIFKRATELNPKCGVRLEQSNHQGYLYSSFLTGLFSDGNMAFLLPNTTTIFEAINQGPLHPSKHIVFKICCLPIYLQIIKRTSFMLHYGVPERILECVVVKC